MGNEFVKVLAMTQLREVIDCMYEKRVAKNCYIIKEGERGEHIYVCAGETVNLPSAVILIELEHLQEFSFVV